MKLISLRIAKTCLMEQIFFSFFLLIINVASAKKIKIDYLLIFRVLCKHEINDDFFNSMNIHSKYIIIIIIIFNLYD